MNPMMGMPDMSMQGMNPMMGMPDMGMQGMNPMMGMPTTKMPNNDRMVVECGDVVTTDQSTCLILL